MRIESVDILRGISIVMMGQYHFMRWFIEESSLPRWLYQLIYIPGRLSAPFFIMISGISAVMLFENNSRKGKRNHEIFMVTLKRGLFLVCLTIPLNIAAAYVFNSGGIWEWNIFQLLGISIILTVIIGKIRMVFICSVFSLVLVLERILSPSFLTIGIVPLIPWINYFFIGNALGLIITWLFSLNKTRGGGLSHCSQFAHLFVRFDVFLKLAGGHQAYPQQQDKCSFHGNHRHFFCRYPDAGGYSRPKAPWDNWVRIEKFRSGFSLDLLHSYLLQVCNRGCIWHTGALFHERVMGIGALAADQCPVLVPFALYDQFGLGSKAFRFRNRMVHE